MSEVTGVQVYYYKICKRRLWFFSRNVEMERNNENVNIGKNIHKDSYSREKIKITIDNTISVDFISEGGEGCVCEVKKSSKLNGPAKYQLLYYLWYLKNKKGVEKEGFVLYPKEKKREKVILTLEEERKIEEILEKIKKVIAKNHPPERVEKPYCNKCSYYEMCWC